MKVEQLDPKGSYLPVYNIKAICRMVGLLPVTLRAWERRYGIPAPQRGSQGYRLYSEYDLRTLRWLKEQVANGMNISRAVEYLLELRSKGYDPAAQYPLRKSEPPESIHQLARKLLQALTGFDEGMAGELMRRAFAIFAMEQVLSEIVEPLLVEIGEAWHNGELPVAVEHYTVQFFMQHLMNALSASPPPVQPGIIAAGCAPGEDHQIGLLMLVLLLRWRGWEVKYLGPDLSLEKLAEALQPLKPKLLLFSATRPENAVRLAGLTEVLARFSEPEPLIVMGGQAFEKMRLPESLPAVYLQASLSESVEAIEKLMGKAGNNGDQ